MKKISTFILRVFVTFCFCAIVGTSVFAQTVRRVNKTPGLNDPSIYTSVQAAHDASGAGDIIYVEPTDVDAGSYGNVTLNRRVTIIGTGYDLGNTPNTSFDKRGVSLGNLSFDNGSAGSLVMGMSIGGVGIYDINCTITRCTMNSLGLGQSGTLLGGIYSQGNYATITNNRFESGISGSGVAGGQAINCIITNNIFNNRAGAVYINSFSGAVINYNTFYCNGGSILNDVDGSTVTNNIFDARDRTLGYLVMGANSNGTTVSNNLCTNVAGLPVGGGNVNSANPNLIFTVGNPWSPYSNDANLQLATSSPAKTVGPGSTPIGVFAGNNPYVLSGVPNVPVITTFTNTGSGTTATPLSVTISVRSAN
ncbi:right-handed parallel beta-helix repeat-containing protein [Emticicia sp. SJ17W-69]|uniref:right-handed parallel beta-helix repeat-containing protein n=1 Tax=Emticicia sp. SJ17W-69 TaxID=3421657 RepID=UPI003EC05F3E